jgi:hypothetical protein
MEEEVSVKIKYIYSGIWLWGDTIISAKLNNGNSDIYLYEKKLFTVNNYDSYKVFWVHSTDSWKTIQNNENYVIVKAWKTNYLIDIKNEKYVNLNLRYWSIKKVKYWKSWIYIITNVYDEQTFYYINNNFEKKNLFNWQVWWQWANYIENFELLENKKIKLFLCGRHCSNKTEKIIDLEWNEVVINNKLSKNDLDNFNRIKKVFSDVDINTFKPFKIKSRINLGNRINTYKDKKYLYFFVMNDDWRRVSIKWEDLKFISWTDYFHNWYEMYYEGWFMWIVKVDIPYKKINFNAIKNLNNDLIIIYDNIFYNWINQKKLWIKNWRTIKSNPNSIFFTADNRVFIIDSSWTKELKWADANTFKCNNETCEDINSNYKIEYWPWLSQVIKISDK